MRYPQIQIDQTKLRHNAERLLDLFRERQMHLEVATDLIAADDNIVQTLIDVGCERFSDARLGNLERLSRFPVMRTLTRAPMLSDVNRVVDACEISYNTNEEVLNRLAVAATLKNKVHGVVLLVESGDLAQGVSADRIVDLAGHVINQEGLELLGVTADFTRIGGIIPDRYNLTALANLARSIEKRYRINLPLINGGGSSALDMVTGGNIPARINCLTIGEALWFGRETSHGHRISDLYLDVFTLVAQVIECQIKDSLPTGERQTYRVDAFPEWENEGKIRRAILALGELDTDCRHLEPKLRGMGFIGSSDGLLVYNVSYLNADLNVGDDVLFSLDRVSLGRCFASSHVSRVMVR